MPACRSTKQGGNEALYIHFVRDWQSICEQQVLVARPSQLSPTGRGLRMDYPHTGECVQSAIDTSVGVAMFNIQVAPLMVQATYPLTECPHKATGDEIICVCTLTVCSWL